MAPLVNRNSLLGLLAVLVSVVFVGCQPSAERTGAQGGEPRSMEDSQAVSVLLRGQRAYQNGQFRRALELAGRAERMNPEDADAPFLKARIFTRLRRLELADSMYREVSEIAPSYKGLWLNWGNLAFREGQYRRALELYRRENNQDLQSRVYTNMGRAYTQLDESDSARIAYQKAIDFDSTNTTALGWMSRFYQEGGNMDQALAFSRRMVRLQPNDPDYRYMLGSQLAQSGQSEAAIPHLRAVLQDRPSHRGAHYNLGRALARLNKSEQANQHLAVADSLEKIESKAERQKTYAQNNPQEPGAWIALGNTLRELGRFRESLQAYQNARTLIPDNPVVMNNLANLYLETGDTTRALRQYRSILRRDSTSADTWFNIGVLYANQGKYKQARKAWQNVLQYRPNDAVAKKYLQMLENS